MIKRLKRFVSLLLAIVMCLNMVPITGYAASGVDYTATLDSSTLTASSEAQTVIMTVRANQKVDIDTVQFTVVVPGGVTVSAVENEDLGFESKHFNANKLAYYTTDAENRNTDLIAKITYTIPAGMAAGAYELGITGLNLSKDYGTPWEKNASAGVTLTVQGDTEEEPSGNVTYSAELDKSEIEVSAESQMVVMTVKANQKVDIDTVQFNVVVPGGVTVSAVENEDLGFESKHFNANKLAYYTADAENRNTDLIAKIMYTIPAEMAAGTYELGITGLNLSKDYGTPWEKGASASVTLTITVPTHTHAPVEKAGQDATCEADGWKSYYECECGDKFEDEAATVKIEDLESWKTGDGKIAAGEEFHEYGERIDEVPAKHENGEVEAGFRAHFRCSVCGSYFDSDKNPKEEEDLIIAAPEHTWDDATCEAPKTCSVCGATDGEELGHDYSVRFQWRDDNTACTVIRVCERNAAHYDTETVDAQSTPVAGTCVVQAKTTYTVTFQSSWLDSEQKTQEKVVTGEVDSNNHVNITILEAVAPTCTATGKTEGKHCNDCGIDVVPQETVGKLDHEYDNGVVTKAPTCQAEGVKTFTCKTCPDSYTEVMGKLEHDWSDVTYEWLDAEKTSCRATVICSGVGGAEAHSQSETAEGTAVEKAVTQIATCKLPEITTYTVTFSNDWAGVYTENVEGNLNPDNHVEVVKVDGYAAACGKTGLTDGEKCTACGTFTVEQEEIPALTHDYDDGVVTKEPTCQTEGVKTYTCKNCPDSYTEVMSKLDHDWSNVTYEWVNTNKTSCRATATCPGLGGAAAHSQSETVRGTAIVKAVTQTATCTQIEITTYTVPFTNDWAGTYIENVEGNKDSQNHTGLVKVEGYAEACEKTGLTDGEKCTDCGIFTVEQEVIPALTHIYDDGVITKDPSCEGMGQKVYTCTRTGCGHSYNEVLNATGHSTVTDAAVDPSCTESGLTEGSHCTACGHVFVEQTVIEKLGHKNAEAVKENVVDVTCTTDGSYDSVVYCTVCGEEQSRETITETSEGHTEETIPAVDATCKTTGLTAGVKCSVCKEILTAQEEIPMTDHNYGNIWKNNKNGHWKVCADCGYTTASEAHQEQILPAQAVTCTEDGKTEGKICSVCDYEILPQSTITASGHKAVVDAAKDATCTEPGLTEGSHCSTCGNTIVAQEVVPAPGHEYQSYERKDATCTEHGWEAYQECTNCGDSTYQEIGALGHEMISHDAKAATCYESGWEAYEECSRCHQNNKVEIPMRNHLRVNKPAQAVTCEVDGWDAYVECGYSDCDYNTKEVIPAPGHDYLDHEAKEATCEETGWEAYQTCSRCDYDTKVEIDKLGHDLVSYNAQAATCTDIGWYAYEECNRCDHTTYKEIPARGHDIKTIKEKPATCTEPGYTAYETCSRCDLNTKVETEALGHDYVNHDAKDATCTEKGHEAYQTCTRCTLNTFKEIAALGHDPIQHEGKAPACEQVGWNAYETCSRCTYTTYREIAALRHNEVTDMAVAPGCETTGLTEGKHCSVCNKVLVAQNVVEALDHTEVIVAAKTATCTESGLTEGKYCSVCEKVLVVQEVVDAIGHKMVDATCTRPAYCENEGCGFTDGAALGHTEVKDEDRMALCEEPGLTEGSHCSACGLVLIPQQETPALGHDMVQHEAKQETYTGAGWEAYQACSRCAYSTKVEIPALGEPEISDYATFLENLENLEEMAAAYVRANPGKDAAALVIKYIRTGVERYNSGSWGIMAGYEDAGFATYIAETEDAYNAVLEDKSQWLMVSGLKNLKNFALPNGDIADLGHVFGMMDITYHNNFGQNHMDIGGWLGDTVDLLSLADQFGVTGTVDEMVKDLTDDYLLQPESSFPEKPIEGSFSLTDMQGDLDGYYIMHNLQSMEYSKGDLTDLLSGYFTAELTDEDRAEYLLKNRLGGVTLREQVRNAVYNAYTGNKMVKTLEDTREFTSADLASLKRACCYAVADYLCRLAGDFVDVVDNSYFEVFSAERSNLAPGITQDIKYATSADGKQMVFYIATADLTRNDIDVYANYTNNDPTKWAMSRVLDQANFVQNKYGNPESEHYIENYNVIASINGAGYNMATGEPGGLLVMGGVEYHEINANGFFGILKDGTPVIGTTEEYNSIYKDQVQEAIASFGARLVKDGKIVVGHTDNYYGDRASRTAVGITKTGKVVFMVLDGRQEPFSCGGSMQEIAQIMLEAGCVEAVNLDGGGSTTYVAKPEGEDALSVVSKPSDGSARSVSTSLIMVSTAPSSTAFDHAILKSDTNYMTVGSVQQIVAEGVSATGNAADIPEGASWAVSDPSYGTIVGNGIFTALKNGSVEINLMLDETVIGTKTMNIVQPDNVYFTKSKVDVVYGESVELPVKALYDGKPVTILPEDLVFTLENRTAGIVNEFTFTAAESSNVKGTKLTVALAHDEKVTASLTIALYNQGEATFNFDMATAGDRQFAWDRKVSNSTTEDNVVYNVVDESKEMVTSYIFAIDMTQIPIPPQLDDLIYMLPGADLENASAWSFLLQLAQRVSVLTEVRPVIQVDPNFDVDYSEATLVNEYFELKEIQMDEETNTLTMVLKWKKQTQAIDPNEANPMCILSGIKVTPKPDAAWNEQESLNVVHSGEIGYDIYLRASSLYTFAQKPENQQTYGLYPFVNPNDSSEAGGHMGAIYTSFTDSYTLVKALKNGWIIEDGGFAYYVEGVKHTGVKLVDGLYYDFGENGINVGQTPYTGVFEQEDGNAYYAKNGKITTGWQQINGVWHLFDETTGIGYHGTYRNFFGVKGVDYVFEKGRLTSGVWLVDSKGHQYYYGPTRYVTGWKVIDGKSYYFQDFYRLEGIQPIKESNDQSYQWFVFDDEGVLQGYAPDGFLEHNGKLYYVKEGYSQMGLQYIDGYYYYFKSDGSAVTGTYYVTNGNGLKPSAYYEFDDQYRMIIKNGIVKENGGIYYYEDGALTYAGLILYTDGYYYYVNGQCKVVTGNYYVTKNNGLMESGYYNFDEEGRMLTKEGFVQENGGIYYYYQGVKTPAGLISVAGNYYYVDGSGKLVTGRYYITKTNGLLPIGYYEFDERGKMLLSDKEGFVTEDDGIYYYVAGEKSYVGLIRVNDYYYYVNANGKVVTGNYYVTKHNGLLASNYYDFDAQGRMIIADGFFEECDGTYYYRDGKRFYAGLIYLDGNYYYVNGRCKRVTGNYYVTENNGLLPSAYYDFDDQGRMILSVKNGFVEEDGITYYYVSGQKTYAGLIQVGGYYYYVNGRCEVVTGNYYVTKNNGLLDSAYYLFDEQGRMIRTEQEGFVEENGVTYYYVDGLKNYAGLIYVDGAYYYVNGKCQVVTGKYFVTKHNDLMPAGYYQFAEDGKMI